MSEDVCTRAPSSSKIGLIASEWKFLREKLYSSINDAIDVVKTALANWPATSEKVVKRPLAITFQLFG